MKPKTLAIALLGTSVVSLAVAAGDAISRTDLDRLAFMAGSWRSSAENASSEEHWLPAKGGVMLGLHRTVRGEKAFFEYLRIERGEDGVLAYVASPMGRPGTAFRLVEVGDRRAVFSAERTDFPQKITYRLDGEGFLHAVVEGEDDGKPRVEEWRWERTTEAAITAPPPEGPPPPAASAD